MMKTFLPFVLAASFTAFASAADSTLAAPDYIRDVAPLFQTYCNGCHNAADREGKLSLEQFDHVLVGGKGGIVVVPGRPELSRLLLVLDGREKPLMPPEGNEAPKSEEIALLKRWIEAGAKGPAGKAVDPTVLNTPKIALTAPPRDPITAVAVSSTGLTAIGSYGRVKLMSTADQATVREFSGLRGQVVDLEFSRDGKLLLAAGGEPGVFGEARLYNTTDGALVRTFTGHRDSLYAASIAADPRTIATASYDQTVKLWNTASGKEVRTLVGHNGAVFDIAFNSAGAILASAGADRTVKLWDVATGARLDTFSQATKEQNAVAFSPDGKTVVSGGADNRLRVYRISPTAKENTNPLIETRYAHEGPVLKIVFSPDGKTLASSGEDRTVRVWDAATMREVKALEKQADWATGLAFTADGKSLVVGRTDGTQAVYDVTSGKIVPPPAPEVAGLAPRGVERGKATMVTLNGKHLSSITTAALVDMAGKPVDAQVRIVAEGRTATTVRLEVTPGAKLPRGNYQVAVSAATGKPAPTALAVDSIPQLAELEPNNAAPKTSPTAIEAGYWGVCERPGDVDHFRFAAKQGQVIVCQLEAKSFGSMLDGFLTILDADGEVAASNNNFDLRDDPLVAYTVPRDGIYAVRVNDQSMNGSPQHFYRLSVGTFPLVTGVHPLNVKAGEESVVILTGYNLSLDALTRVKPMKPGETAVTVDVDRYRLLKPLTVRATADVETNEHEPNNAPAETKTVALPASINGRIFVATNRPATDVDLFRFQARKGQTLLVETEAERRGSPVDTKIEILTIDGKPVPRVVLQAVRDSYITFRGIDSNGDQARLFNWEEMELNQYVYMSGEIAKFFRKPQGPDSGFQFYLSAGKRRCYFDTSPSGHALDEPAYVVEAHPIGTPLVNNGLPVYTLNYANDDDGLRRLGADSRLTFTAPADGEYLVRVSDVRGFSGDNFNYRLVIREPRPDFNVTLSKNAPAVGAGGTIGLSLSAERIDDFDGDIVVDVRNLPVGYSMSTPVTIQAGHDSARVALSIAAEAKPVDAAVWKKVELSARGVVAGRDVVKPVAGFTSVTIEPKPKLVVRLEPAEITIAPGQTVSAMLKIERNGFKERVAFDVANLPHGVIVDNIGLNGILIPEGQTERQVFLTCDSWVPETDRTFFAETKTPRAGGGKVEFEASGAVLLKVRKPATLAEADGAKAAAPSSATSPK